MREEKAKGLYYKGVKIYWLWSDRWRLYPKDGITVDIIVPEGLPEIYKRIDYWKEKKLI